MPFSSEGLTEGTGLALSGGGFRATLFHCGSLWRLTELGLLQKLDRVSSVSGGSITAGQLGLKWTRLADAGFTLEALKREVIDPLRAFCRRNLDIPAVVEGVLLPFKSIADVIAAAYADGLFGKATLQDLPDAPRFIFNTTNLATGVDFRFSKPYAGDYRIGLIRAPRFRLAQAVAASSAFPPFLSPVVLEPEAASFEKVEGADLYDDVSFRTKVTLTDGGVYDNLGLETVWKRLRTLLVSDAGTPIEYAGVQGRDWPRQGIRVIYILMHQAWAQRTRLLVQLYKAGERKGAYWGIGTPISRYQVPGALAVSAEVTDRLAKVRTRLNPFNDSEQCCLINWGYAICDGAIRKYGQPALTVPASWPYPAYALDGPAPAAVTTTETTDLVPSELGLQL
jgi:NTE family protein